MSVCIFLAEQCGGVIREVEASGNLQIKIKGPESPVTIADIRVQKTIEENLMYLYPTLNVQGEESKDDTSKVSSAVKPSEITKEVRNFIDQDYLNSTHKSREKFILNVLRRAYDDDEVQTTPFETFNTTFGSGRPAFFFRSRRVFETLTTTRGSSRP